MSESVVECPSCGKKYRVRADSGPGSFQCTGCSATVPYGDAPAAAQPARARPARPAGRGRGAGRGAPRGAGRGPARARPAAAAPAGRARGRRGYRRGGDEDGPPPKSNTGLYVGLGIGAVVVIGVVAVLLLSSKKSTPAPLPTTEVAGQPSNNNPPATGPGMVQPLNPTPGMGGTPSISNPTAGGMETVPEALRPSAEPDTPNQPTGSSGGTGGRGVDVKPGEFYGGDRMALRRKSLGELAAELVHFDDTAGDLRSEIDKLCDTIVDFNAGSDGNRAQDRLKEIGRAGIPKVLASWIRCGDITGREGMINACFVDGTIRAIVGNPSGFMQLTPMAHPDKNTIEKTIKAWYVWWFTKGYTMKEFNFGSGDDDEDE